VHGQLLEALRVQLHAERPLRPGQPLRRVEAQQPRAAARLQRAPELVPALAPQQQAHAPQQAALLQRRRELVAELADVQGEQAVAFVRHMIGNHSPALELQRHAQLFDPQALV